MAQKRRKFSQKFKFKVALEAVKGMKTLNQIAAEHQLHPNQVSQWKRQLMQEGSRVFEGKSRAAELADAAERETQLYEQIGRLQMELAWLKKKLPTRPAMLRAMIDPKHTTLSIRRQCEVLGLNRSSYYYQPANESPLNLELMRLIDEQYMRTPYLGYPKMTVYLRKRGFEVNRKRVYRLMRLMGLQAVYPKPRTSVGNHEHKIYPYLLRNMEIVRPNQVWCADITYVPMPSGFMYLVAVMDWFSRYVLSWEVSNSLDRTFCLSALDAALTHGRPDIFNTDQGAQFTSHDFTGRLLKKGIRVSMDGRGRMMDNIFIERLWRSVKYEHIYLHCHETVPQLLHGLDGYFSEYNEFRPHQALKYDTPADVYFRNQTEDGCNVNYPTKKS